MDRLELARNASAVVFLGTLVSVPAESVEASDCILDRTVRLRDSHAEGLC
jgi:hypothetical protein